MNHKSNSDSVLLLQTIAIEPGSNVHSNSNIFIFLMTDLTALRLKEKSDWWEKKDQLQFLTVPPSTFLETLLLTGWLWFLIDDLIAAWQTQDFPGAVFFLPAELVAQNAGLI